jgi:hypothetical protein
MPNPWDTDPTEAPAAAAAPLPWESDPTEAPQQAPVTAAGLAKAGGIGLVKGALGLAGSLGDARERLKSVIHGASKSLGYEIPEDTIDTALRIWAPILNGPTSQTVRAKTESVTGPLYEPQNTAEDYAQTVGEFAPNAAFGPGGIVRKAAQVVLPALASETAGQLTKGTDLEPYARGAAAIVAGGATGATRERTPAPTVQELHDASNNGYRAARATNLEIDPDAVGHLGHMIETDLINDGLTPRNVPETYATIRALQDPTANPLIARRPGGITAADFENARQELVQARRSANPREAVAANRAIDHLDNYLSNIPQVDVLRGDAAQASQLFDEARANWAAYRRAEMVQNALGRGQLNADTSYSGQNIDNATRQAVKSLIRPPIRGQSPAQKAGFNADEIQAMRDLSSGNFTRNTLRAIGKLGPTGLVGGGFHTMAALHTGGASIPLSVGAYIAKKISDAATGRSANRLDEMVRGNAPLGWNNNAGLLMPRQGLHPLAAAGLSGLLAMQQQP